MNLLQKSGLQLRQESMAKHFAQFKIKQDLQNFKNNLRNNILYGHKNNKLNCGLLLGNMNTGAYRGSAGWDFEFDFSDATGWTQVNTGVSIDTVTNQRIDGFGADATDRRIWYDMLVALSDTAWVTRFPFQYTAQNNPYHHPIGFSSISNNPSGEVQDYLGFGICINANESRSIKADGVARGSGTFGTIITTALSTQYYIEMIRLSATQLELGIKSDSGYTTDITNSPQTQTIDNTIIGLRYIHSSNDSTGAGTRTLTGFIDDLKVASGVTVAP